MKKNSKPAIQGDFDGTCGFYSVGNALSLLFQNIDPDKIFGAIFSYYDKEYGDVRSFFKGIHGTKLNKILKGTQGSLKLKCSIDKPYRSRPAYSLTELHNTLLNYSIGTKSVAIIRYEYLLPDYKGFYNHWTVLKKVTEKSLITHDSCTGTQRISLLKCRIWNKKNRHDYRKPYRLSSRDLFIITKSETEAR